jgi:hypothetical protein
MGRDALNNTFTGDTLVTPHSSVLLTGQKTDDRLSLHRSAG